MPRRSPQDYETVKPSRRAPPKLAEKRAASPSKIGSTAKFADAFASISIDHAAPFLKRGHVLSFAALFLFTLLLYVRPAELYPSPWTNSIALIVGVITLASFLASQISLEGTL